MPEKIYRVNQKRHEQSTLIYAGLIGIGIFFVIDLISETPLDLPLTIALYCFSISIPFLALLILFNQIMSSREYAIFPVYATISAVIGVIGALLGTLAEFWHVSWIAGGLFALCSLWGLVSFALFRSSLEKVNNEAGKQDAD